MRALLVALSVFAGPAWAAVYYGTPAACSFVAAGHDPQEVGGGIEGESESYFFNGALFVGPDFACDVGDSTADCSVGGEGKVTLTFKEDVSGDVVSIRIGRADQIVLERCR